MIYVLFLNASNEVPTVSPHPTRPPAPSAAPTRPPVPVADSGVSDTGEGSGAGGAAAAPSAGQEERPVDLSILSKAELHSLIAELDQEIRIKKQQRRDALTKHYEKLGKSKEFPIRELVEKLKVQFSPDKEYEIWKRVVEERKYSKNLDIQEGDSD